MVAKDLSVSYPDQCVNLLLGKPHVNIEKYIRKESLDAELTAFNEVILSPRINKLKIASDTENEEVFIPILIKQAKDFNIPVEEVGNYFDGNQEANKSCLFIMAVMNDLLKLPVSKVASVLRNGAQKQ
ncbi:MAG: hypothetical protein EAY76_00145 [Alphaproteobacteria bacterium]|nr:MAG: hypothetical protein EAY76_00145 [Alphaproteobacteria bacterium]